jgi:hypothetical protein
MYEKQITISYKNTKNTFDTFDTFTTLQEISFIKIARKFARIRSFYYLLDAVISVGYRVNSIRSNPLEHRKV